MRAFTGTLVLLALAAPIVAAENGTRPRLDLRATPRMAFSPTVVYVTAELAGGDEVEELYCPEVEWDWDDGARSHRGSDCPPFQAGQIEFERFFSADHVYRQAGSYNVKITMKRAGRTVAAATSKVEVRPGLGDFSE
ncbi:MAG TPA: hypothetical protein VFQ51_00450 [Vicinamibacteria bacterium]|nr:hypothetical protein [Vicinamibacteria bacterium]